MAQNIGIYSGTFDPIHDGHIAFATVSRDQLGLNKVVFLPEESPRCKTNVTSLSERKLAIENRIADDDGLAVLTLVQPQFTLIQTLPAIRELYPSAAITLLVGSDVALHLHQWLNIETLQANYRLAIGLRVNCNKNDLIHYLDTLAIKYDLITTDYASHTSSQLRRGSQDLL